MYKEQLSYDLAILGGGPAGLSASLYATRYGLDAVTIERGVFGGQIATTSDLDNYPGLPAVGGSELGELMRSHTASLGTKFLQDEVTGLEKTNSGYLLHSYSGDIACKALIYAAGGEPRHAGFVGEDEFRGRGVSYCATCDGMFYKDKSVFVIGGGNTACDEALFLAGLASDVTLIVRKDRLRADRALQESVLSNDGIKVRYLTTIQSVRGSSLINEVTLTHAVTGTEEVLEFPAGGVGLFVAVGQLPAVGLIKGFVNLASDGSVLTDDAMAANNEGLFCAGDVRHKTLRQVITAASDGAIAAHSAAEYLRGL